MMSDSSATWMVGITHRVTDGEWAAYVSLSVGLGSRIDLGPVGARQLVRQLLLCVDDVEEFNRSQQEKDEEPV